MNRSRSLIAAAAAILFNTTGITAPVQSPPTPIRLVDVQGRPVAGAVVGIDLQYDRDRSPSFTSRQGIEARTDERGEASLTIKYETGIYAIREDKDHPLVGVALVTRAQLGKPARIVMSPACKVRLRVECPGFRELEEQYHAELGGPTWERLAVVQPGDDRRAPPLLVALSRTGELEVLLTPGRYTIRALGDDTKSVSRSVEIQAGHRVRSLGLIEVSPSADVKHGILREFWRWNQQDLQEPPGGEDTDRRVVYRRRERGAVPRDTAGIQHLAFSPDGKVVATSHGYNDRPGEVKLWDARTVSLTATLTGPDGEDGVHQLAFAPDGAILAGSVASMHNFQLPSIVILWDVAGRRVKRTLRGHTATITAMAFAPDGQTLASGAGDKTVRFWDVASGRETGRFEVDTEWPHAIAYAPDGQTLAVTNGETLKLWDIPGTHFRATLESGGFWFQSLAFAPDGRTLAASGMIYPPIPPVRDGQVRLYDMTSKPPRRRATLTLDPGGPPWANAGKDFFGDVVFTPDGRHVLSVMVGRIAMWDAASGAEIAWIVRNNGISTDRLAVSPDGRWLGIAAKFGSYASMIAIPQPPVPGP